MTIGRRSPWHSRRALRREVERGYFRHTGIATTPEEFAEETRDEPRLPLGLVERMSHAFRYYPGTGTFFSVKRRVDRTWAIRTLRFYGWQHQWLAQLFGVSAQRIGDIVAAKW